MYCFSPSTWELKEWMILTIMGGTPVIAFILDRLLGDPSWLLHPIVFIGRLIGVLEKGIRAVLPKTKTGELFGGFIIVVLTLVISGTIPTAILYFISKLSFPLAVVVNLMWCWQILAARSLKEAAIAVAQGMRVGGLEEGRRRVAMIVGRDVDSLDEEGVIKATVETVAENTTDGVVAPLIFIAIGGAPLGFFYKAINTMDSMIGYRNQRYRYFGRVAARLDDVVNFLPARLTALLMVLVAPVAKQETRKNSWRIFRRDRRQHASPNSGQTESAMAGALGIQLAGDAVYFNEIYEKPTIGDDDRPVEVEDIIRSCAVMYASSWLSVAIALIIGFCLGGGIC